MAWLFSQHTIWSHLEELDFQNEFGKHDFSSLFLWKFAVAELLFICWLVILEILLGKNCYLQPKYFNIEIFLRVNLGQMHLLKDFVNDVFDKLFLSDPKDYIRKGNRISKITSQDMNKMKRNLAFQTHFGNPALPNDSKLYIGRIVKPCTTCLN